MDQQIVCHFHVTEGAGIDLTFKIVFIESDAATTDTGFILDKYGTYTEVTAIPSVVYTTFV